MASGIPDNCVNHPEVEWITIRVPVYTGGVSDADPTHLDRLAARMLTKEERIGFNRVCEGYRRVYPAPANETSHPQIARWVFAVIGEAFTSLTPRGKKR